MPEWKDIINFVIALIGVCVTGFFSFKLVKATKATNELAEATLNLNREISERDRKREEQFRQQMRIQLIPEILTTSEKVEKALADVDPMKIHQKLRDVAPKKLTVERELLARYFSEDEVKLITNAWNAYEDYLEKYYKPTYGGDEINTLVEHTPYVLTAFNEVINVLKYNTH